MGTEMLAAYAKGRRDFSHADLSGADLSGADLSGTDLRNADLRNADLRGTDLRETDLRGAKLSGTDLRNADLRNADLRNADLRGTDLRETNLRGADLSGADLRNAAMIRADLRGADLSGADLRGATDLPAAPVIPNIDAAILAEIVAGGVIDMDRWHTCETTHCRAGWAIHLADEAGAALERRYGANGAGALIYAASRPNNRVPNWFASAEEALADLRASAAEAAPVQP